jgi:uncharacterized protein
MGNAATLKQNQARDADARSLQVVNLENAVHELYLSVETNLPFHGWHHVYFVKTKAVEFAHERSANPFLVAAASIVHDLNYVVRKNSSPSAARRLRRSCLKEAGFDPEEMNRIEKIVNEAHTSTRTGSISVQGAALSDADTLFKALPMTPVIFAHLYLSENGIGLRELGSKILQEQIPLLEKDIYFYDPVVREKYLPWAKVNIQLWQEIMAALDDPDIVSLLDAIDVKM